VTIYKVRSLFSYTYQPWGCCGIVSELHWQELGRISSLEKGLECVNKPNALNF